MEYFYSYFMYMYYFNYVSIIIERYNLIFIYPAICYSRLYIDRYSKYVYIIGASRRI